MYEIYLIWYSWTWPVWTVLQMVSYEKERFSWEFSDPARKINIYPRESTNAQTLTNQLYPLFPKTTRRTKKQSSSSRAILASYQGNQVHLSSDLLTGDIWLSTEPQYCTSEPAVRTLPVGDGGLHTRHSVSTKVLMKYPWPKRRLSSIISEQYVISFLCDRGYCCYFTGEATVVGVVVTFPKSNVL